MNSIGVGSRTRRQLALKEKLNEENKRNRFPTRRSGRARLNKGSKSSLVNEEDNDNDDDDDDDIKVLDESEFERMMAARKAIKKEPMVDDPGDSKAIKEEPMVDDPGDIKEGGDTKKDDGISDEDSNDSVKIIGEKWNPNPNDCSESHSLVTSSDSDDDETTSTHKGAIFEVGGSSSGEIAKVDEQMSSSSKTDNETTSTRKVAILEVGGSSSGEVFKVDEQPSSSLKTDNEKKRDSLFGKRVFEGLVISVDPEHNAQDDDFVGRRTRSHRKKELPREKRIEGTLSCPFHIDDDSHSSSDDDHPQSESGSEPEPEFVPEPVNNLKQNIHKPENDSSIKRNRPHKGTYVEPESESESEFQSEPMNNVKPMDSPRPMNPKPMNNVKLMDPPKPMNPNPMYKVPKPVDVPKSVDENVVKRKRGRPPKDKTAEKEFKSPKKKGKSKINALENILLNTILKNGDNPACSLSEVFIPLKFSFRLQKSVPDKSEKEEEIEGLFKEMDFALRAFDVGGSFNSSDESEEDSDVGYCYGAVTQEKLCSQGKHYLILDDEIGIKCQFCSFMKLEIRNVTPGFEDNPFGGSRYQNKRFLYYDEYVAAVSSGIDISKFQFNSEPLHSDIIHGTVWDLIPGIKKSLYPHQQEAFEFIWKNVSGSTKLDELNQPTNSKIGGCIICHAPGTGKTRLAITFLQSYIKRYPMSKPVIIAPTSMLLTWEEEFARWNFDVPIFNLNKPELSGREDKDVLGFIDSGRNIRSTRLAKLCSWSKGKGILGISYRLFEKLAGESCIMGASIQRVLLEQPGILVLDEGHTPRNDDTKIWNALTKVKTKRRIILSGTPFQNNFEELHNTLSLVRKEFGNPNLLGGHLDDDKRIIELRKRMKPFVHVHKGEILKKKLKGLFQSVLFLKPSDLQKTCCEKLSKVSHIVERNHLISVACVHPSGLSMCTERLLEGIDKALLEKCKDDLDVGLKIRFLFELINLTIGEKILVFNQYLDPLNLILELLKSRFHWEEGKDFLYMQGKVNPKQRQSFINSFNDPNSKVKVLFASTKACGEGINLVGASRVVLLDVVWNPSVERQAISRAYRIGQKKDVFVYHLILSGTLEEEKYQRLVNKDRISELVFTNEGEKVEKEVNLGLKVLEDRVLDTMVQNEKTSSMFTKIIREFKADELIKTFSSVNP